MLWLPILLACSAQPMELAGSSDASAPRPTREAREPDEASVVPQSTGELRVLPEGQQQIFAMGAAVYHPARLIYRFGNFGDRQFDYALSCAAPWLTLSNTAGRLQPNGRSELVLSIDAAKTKDLQPGWHVAEVSFVNSTNGNGSTTRSVRLLIRAKSGLLVEPSAEALITLSEAQAASYLLRNSGDAELAWEALPTEPWIGVQPASGTLAGGESIALELSLLSQADQGRPADSRSASLSILNRTDGVGTTLRKLLIEGATQATAAEAEPSPTQSVASITQFGITWTFVEPVQAGNYANGDWWVLGPVLIMDISPNSSSLGARVRNGSMINPSPKLEVSQGFDSATYDKYKSDKSYLDRLNSALDVNLMQPLLLRAGSSLVSSISHPEAGRRPQLTSAAILTCVERVPQAGAFRPPYSGRDKRSHFAQSQLRPQLLAKLKAPAAAPSWSEVERMFERPWIDHVPISFGRYLHPAENMPDYARDMCDQVGIGAMMLHVDASLEKKHTLLVRYVQLGIDLHGVLMEGGSWRPEGGHGSGRKWPILFAGLMLGDARMQSIGVEYEPVTFGEDGQTFYVGDPRPELGYLEEHRGLAEWGVTHARTPENDDVRWRHTDKLPAGAKEDADRTHDLKYRLCCTANAWWGQLLAARIMGARELWNHDPLFDYQDRYFELNKKRKIFDENMAWSKFSLQMWRQYRKDY